MNFKKTVLLLLHVFITTWASAQLVSYQAPKGAALNFDYTVKVRQNSGPWKTLPTYLATVANSVNGRSQQMRSSFAYFDFLGEVEVSITYQQGSIETAKVRPVNSGIVPQVSGKTILLRLKEPKKLSVEINGDIFHNLQLFAGPVEKNKPLPSDTNVIYFGPGIHQAGVITPRSNQTIYIDGGAIVQARILINKVHHVRILGRGILTQLPVVVAEQPGKDLKAKPQAQNSRNDQLTIEYSKDIKVDGIIVLPHRYSILIGQSNNVEISNFKSFSFEGNADGIDVFCSADVKISDIFMRNSDDCIAIYGHRWNYYGNVERVAVDRAVLWADIAHPINIGTHGDPPHPDTLRNLSFKNIDILEQHEHQVDYQGCMALNAGDSNLITDVIFDDVRVEDFREGQLFNLRVMYNHKYNTSAGNGISNILFRNVNFMGKHANLSVITGYDENRKIQGLVFENLQMNGTVITDTMAAKPGYYKTADMAGFFIGEHVDDVKFIATKKD